MNRQTDSFSFFQITALVICAGLMFWQSTAVAAIEFEVDRFMVEGENPLRGSQTAKILEPYLGEHTGLERLQEASTELEKMLRDRGYAFYRVILPPQKLQDRTIKLEVRSFKIVQLSVEGLDNFSEQNIRRSMPDLKIGTSPNIQRLSRALAEANRHPSKNLQVTFAVSRETGELEARIAADDQKPGTFFSWFDNTGTERTGRYRFGIGLQHTNLFDRDHTITVTATASPEDPEEVHQLGLQYRIPLYRLGSDIEFIAADSTVDSATFEGETFEVSGAGQVLGLRFRKGLPKFGTLRHDVVLSWFDKQFQNETRFVGTTFRDTTVASRPLGLEYRAALQGRRLSSNWYVGHYFNLDNSGSNNSDENYDSVRLGARSNWSSTRFGGALGYTLGEWILRGKLDAQTASEPLIPGEQFTYGGMRSVRGFAESEFAEDRGVQASLEIWTPRLKLGPQLLGFVDYGYGKRVRTDNDPLVQATEIGSVGLGVRWAWQQRIRARLDYGYVFEAPDPLNDESTERGDSKVHASVIYLF